MATGYTNGDDTFFLPQSGKKRITEGKYAPKLKVKSRYELADGKPLTPADIRVDQDIWLPPFSGDTNPFMSCLDKNGNYKKTFKIEVGNIPDDQIEDYLKKIAERFKAVNRPIPDLDCGVYKEDED